MSNQGRPRKPQVLHFAHGTARADRMNPDEPKPKAVSEMPKAPSHLNKWGKRVWNDLGTTLMVSRLLTHADLVTFEILCEYYGQYRELWDEIHCFETLPDGRRRRRTLAQYLRGRSSQTVPEYAAMKSALKGYESLLVQFGMSPATRSKVSALPDEKPEDEMSKLLEGRG